MTRSFRQVWVDECSWIVPVGDDNIFDVPAKVGGSGELAYSWGTYIVSSKNSEGVNASNAPPDIHPVAPDWLLPICCLLIERIYVGILLVRYSVMKIQE